MGETEKIVLQKSIGISWIKIKIDQQVACVFSSEPKDKR
jgi:hypothetical protein